MINWNFFMLIVVFLALHMTCEYLSIRGCKICVPKSFWGKHILADSAYTLQQNVITPYKEVRALSGEEVLFNRVFSSSRSMVECAIGLLKLR